MLNASPALVSTPRLVGPSGQNYRIAPQHAQQFRDASAIECARPPLQEDIV
jgi:hypothetical protein